MKKARQKKQYKLGQPVWFFIIKLLLCWFFVSVARQYDLHDSTGIACFVICFAVAALFFFWAFDPLWKSIKKQREDDKPVFTNHEPALKVLRKPPLQETNPESLSWHCEETPPSQCSQSLSASVTIPKATQDTFRFSEELSSIPRFQILPSDTPVSKRVISKMPAVSFSNITVRTIIDRIFPLVVIDTETTGLFPSSNEIIEVSAIRYDVDFVPVSCFTSLVKPSSSIPSKITEITGISNSMVSDSPAFSEIANSLSSFCSGCNIAGHNLLFDLEFLYVNGVSFSQKTRYYDTLTLAKRTLISANSTRWDPDLGHSVPVDDYDVENYKLSTLCDYFGISRDDAHRALSDCHATAKVFENLIAEKRRRAMHANMSED